MKKKQPEKRFPKQKQTPPGKQSKMKPKPKAKSSIKGSGKLKGKVALITGGDSGIGRSVAIDFAKEGASVAIVYLSEHDDAKETKRLVEEQGGECLLIPGNIGKEAFCRSAVKKTVKELGKLDILVNNAAEQKSKPSIKDISEAQLVSTFRTNIFAMFFLVKAALDELVKNKGTIINTTSVTAYRGSKELLDYSATKGAIVAFTRSLALSLIEHGIRVNAVAPGPIWTPLIPSTVPQKKVETFGSDTPMERVGQPSEVSPCFVFLASEDSSYMSGQVLHPNGGEIVNA